MKETDKEIINAIDYNKVYKSIDGDFIFLPNTITIGTESIKINVMFLYTAYIKNVNINKALDGNIDDPFLKYMDREYHSGVGEPIKLLKYAGKVNGTTFVRIRYLIYEYECNVNLRTLLNSNVKNPYYPSFCGIGYIGEPGPYLTKHIDCWHGMMSRCYNVNDRRYRAYGGFGVTVCKEWHCFATFLNDIKLLENYDLWLESYNKYQLDKDVLQNGIPKENKIYSPTTCKFILKTENLNQMILDNIGKSSYIGVYISRGTSNYAAYITVLGERYYLGMYTIAEAAANAYNIFILQNGLNRPLNNVRPMTVDEVNSYLTSSNEYINYIEFAKSV